VGSTGVFLCFSAFLFISHCCYLVVDVLVVVVYCKVGCMQGAETEEDAVNDDRESI
jgi:hypothetical protein